MKYEPIPSHPIQKIRSVVFNPDETMDNKRLHLLSAFYSLKIETVDALLLEILNGTDLGLKLCALRNVEAFAQNRSTTLGIPSSLHAIKEMISANPEHRPELSKISETLREYQKIFSSQAN